MKFVSERGFLFLVPDGSGPDIFAHVSKKMAGTTWTEVDEKGHLRMRSGVLPE